jgi:nucleoside-diphosphate-sugar epimerase
MSAEERQDQPPKVLIAGARGRLGRAVAEVLHADFALRQLDDAPLEGGESVETCAGSLLNAADAARAVRGVDAVIHTGDPPDDLPVAGIERERALLDLATRGTYNLCHAAVEAGVRRLVFASTLHLFDPYPDDLNIDTTFRPRPSTEIEPMTRFLGEQTCQQFARNHKFTVTVLRFGTLVRVGETAPQTVRAPWLDVRDAAAGCRGALKFDDSDAPTWIPRWRVFHVCAREGGSRFYCDVSKALSFELRHRFEQPGPPRTKARDA